MKPISNKKYIEDRFSYWIMQRNINNKIYGISIAGQEIDEQRKLFAFRLKQARHELLQYTKNMNKVCQ